MATVIPEKQFRTELHHYQDVEVEADLRAERAEEWARYLITTSEYNPYSFENFSEALAHMEDSDMQVIAACMSEAVEQNLDNPLTNHLVLCAIKRAVENYWLDVARYVAKQKINREW